MEIQSGLFENAPATEDETPPEQVVSFVDNTPGSQCHAARVYDDVMSDIYTADYELGDFLSRPVEIRSYTIPVGASYAEQVFDPWFDFFNHAQIKRKLDNYGYVQCTLNIKVLINATPFIYGAMGLSYHPLDGLTLVKSNGHMIPLSQRQTIWITPQNSSGGEMTLPFFHYKNWLEIHDQQAVKDFGYMSFWQLAQFEAANANLTSSPSVTIYAWANDVRLAANTVKLALQSSGWEIQSKEDEVRPAEKAKDEYGETPVAKTATAVAEVAGAVAGVTAGIPIIGQFAKATSIGAGILATVASIFGFTNVPVIDNSAPYKSMPFHGLASSEIGNVVDKLTLDPKNELSIDPQTVGLPGTDELAIAYLTQKESVLAVANWDIGDAKDVALVLSNVTPTLCEIVSEASQDVLYDTPCGMASRMFSNWRGDLIVRLKIICSQYHKGRLRVSYDPLGDIYIDADNTTVVQNKIIDISESSNIEIRIPYMAPTSWLRVRDTAVEDFSVKTAVAAVAPTYDTDFHNGRLTVRVLNELTAPVDTADVKVVVSVRAAENFELSNPSDIEFSDAVPSQFEVQSRDELWDSEESHHTMGKSTPPPKNRYLVNMGESVQSTRVLLRRAHFVNTERCSANGVADSSSTFYKFTMTKYPPAIGFDPNGIHEAQSLTAGPDHSYNFVSIHPYTWLATCFIGQRGSMIWHFNACANQNIDVMRVRRVTETSVATRAALRDITTNVVSSSFSGTSRGAITRGGPGASGLSLINQKTQTGLSVLFPQYSKYRFVSADPAYAVFGRDLDDTENEKLELDIVTSNAVANDISFYERYCSIGTDFNFFYFVNVPPRYLYSLPTATGF